MRVSTDPMTPRPPRTTPVRLGSLALSGMLAMFAIGVSAIPAAATASCELRNHVLSVVVPDLAQDEAFSVMVFLHYDEPWNKIALFSSWTDQIRCTNGPATILNTNRIVARGPDTDSTQVFRIGSTIPIDQLPQFPTIDVDLGPGDDSVWLNGCGYDDAFVLGSLGINLDPSNGDSVDVTTTGIESFGVILDPGDDVASAAGGSGTGGPVPVLVTITGDKGDDVLIGGAARDHIYAGHPDGSDDHPGGDVDTVRGGPGDDLIMGASEVGDVAVLEGGPGADELDGGVGFDIASYAGSASAVTGTVGGIVSGGDATGDTLDGIEGLTGSAHDDVLTGDPGANVLSGGDGDDVLAGLGGDDVLAGGKGLDRADYSAATASVVVNLSTASAQPTGAGSDSLRKIENVTGSSFDDVLTGHQGTNRLEGGPGDDVLAGLDGADTLDGGDGVDLARYTKAKAGVVVDLALTGAQDTLGAGIDTLTSIENLDGTAFGDEMAGDAAANAIGGRGGGDVLDGRDGDDHLVGMTGNDALTGGPGTDLCFGGPGSDEIAADCEVTDT